jgi:hypothetical protein
MNAELHWELEDMRAYVDWNDMPGEVQRLTPQLNIPAQSLEMSGDEVCRVSITHAYLRVSILLQLLFNLSYFNSGEISDTQLSRMYSTAVDEALAAHSPANSYVYAALRFAPVCLRAALPAHFIVGPLDYTLHPAALWSY